MRNVEGVEGVELRAVERMAGARGKAAIEGPSHPTERFTSFFVSVARI